MVIKVFVYKTNQEYSVHLSKNKFKDQIDQCQ